MEDYFEMMEKSIPRTGVRTRFAPSPTGYMHIGNLRTALYAYLIARRSGGTFILRIEDTDQARFVGDAEDVIRKTLAECGLNYDEGPDVGGPAGPYVQSQRKDIYRRYADLLIEKGSAYRCFCTQEELSARKAGSLQGYDGHCSRLSAEEIGEKLDRGVPHVVRQRIPKTGSTTFHDAVFGEITTPNAALDDNVLLKSDGMPTYNFANVVDDHLMGITHVVRGTEYLSSTPKYNLLYSAFGWSVPEYIHCPPVMRDAQHKLSKRAGDPTFDDLISAGYLVPAVLNYVALLGWSPGGEQEIFSLKQMEEIFDISGISRSPAIFDINKLTWFNSEYIRAMTPEEFSRAAGPYIAGAVKNPALDVKKIAALVQGRCQVLSDIPGRVDFFGELGEYSPELYVNKKMKTDRAIALEALKWSRDALLELRDWSEESIKDTLLSLAASRGVKNGVVMWPVRVAVSGKEATPGGATELCDILGREESLRRIDRGIELLGGK